MNSSDSSWRKIAFFGRIMANVSHEFNNIITVISELAGLLKDLTLMSQKGREIPPEKLASISENISRQVARGKNLITHMNRFSHSSDEPVTRVDAGQIVENIQVNDIVMQEVFEDGFQALHELFKIVRPYLLRAERYPHGGG